MANGEFEAGSKRRTPLRGALLGLLLEEPGSGAELASRLASRLGSTWKIEPKGVYRLLEELEAEGLAISHTQPRQGRARRLHVVYEPTAEASRALTDWMEALLPREPVRLGVHAKLAVAREQDAPTLLNILEEYEQECLSLLSLVDGGDACGDDGWYALTLECARDSIRSMLAAEIEWARRAHERISQFETGRDQ